MTTQASQPSQQPPASAAPPPGVEPEYAPTGADVSLGHRQDRLDRADAPDQPRLAGLLRPQHPRDADASSGVVIYLLVMGVGIWGIDIPVAWGFAITSFVWWIGIGHAGTLISAILLLDAPEMADFDQPAGRGHDHLRRHVRRPVPPAAPGPAVVLLLAAALPQTRWGSGRSSAVPWSGTCSRSAPISPISLLVLVHGHDPRPGHAARPGEDPHGPS